MKTEQEVRAMLRQRQERIDHWGKLARQEKFGSREYEQYDREYAKAVAQYNILLEVLK